MSLSGDNEVELLGDNHDGKPNTRLQNQKREMEAHQQQEEQERNKVKVKEEKMLEKGFTYCPVCKMKNLVVRGCKTITCTRTRGHPNRKSAFYCGYCQMLSKNGDPPKCKCRYSFNITDRLEVAANPELRTVDLSNDDFSEGLEYYQSIPEGGDEDNTSRASTGSSSASEKMDDGKDSNATDSDTSTKTTSEAAMNEDDDVQDEVPTAVLSDRTIKIKQDPDTVPSAIFDEETVGNEISPQEDMSSTAILPVMIKIKTEGVNDSAAFHEETDVEDSASSKEDGGEEEEDVAALVYQEYQLRKRGAAAEEEEQAAPKKRRKVSSSRKGGSASKGKRKSSEYEEESAPTAKVVIDLSDVPPQPPVLKKEENVKEGASKYAGVSFHKQRKKWQAKIKIEGKTRHISWYEDEEEAAIDYARAVFKYKGQDALDEAREQQNSVPVIDLSDVPPQLPIPKKEGYIKEGASKYTGVTLLKASNKWQAKILIEGKNRHIGIYENEEEAAIDYARAVFKYKRQRARKPCTSAPAIDLSDVPPQPPIPKSQGYINEGASKYAGVSFHKASNKWHAMISIEGKQCYIGSYENEEEAAIDYARAVFKYKGQRSLDEAREQQNSVPVIDLSDVPPQLPIPKKEGYIKEGASKYIGVTFNKASKKWKATISIEGKQRHIGIYENEEEAAIDYARAVFKYKKGKRKSSEDKEESAQRHKSCKETI